MQKRALVKTLGLTFGAVLMTACASNGDMAEGSENQPLEAAQEVQETAETTGVETQAVVGEQVDAAESAAQAALMEATVFYFDFDNTTIKADSKNALIAHSQYLAANSSARVVLEGHADERGTVEYNLALGERRALSVSRFLQANGASASQIETVSFGEERPALMGHSDASWSKNRRVEIKYQSK
ncbi:MAG TPA: peptidoglycan-associated lipoprotein Pal [Oceanospirillales bacterium]|nr:peptidoglycan-associated lipoprotein Pal [Oceanospirillales bacterium]|tara:strand:+ start:12282 stop:12836 length:555 start_codon:yes stop_codon:yes gene_type:complete